MKVKQILPPICRLAFVLAVLGLGIGASVNAHAAPPPVIIKPGEVILYLQPGTTLDDANALAAQVQAQVTPMLLKDCYKLVLPANNHNDQDTTNAVAKLRPDPRVKWVNPNTYKQLMQAPPTAPTVTPNDPRFGEQWDMRMINMPQAWVLQKGVTDVNVAVIDSGFDVNHEDLQKRYSDGSFDFTANSSNVAPDGAGPALQHGVHVSGTIVANTDNGIGIASVTWQNTLCVGLKVHKKGDPDPQLDTAAIINSLQYCADNKDKYHIVAINESLGGGGDPTDATNPEYVATKNCTDKGIIVCVAAGNSSADDKNFIPAGYKFSPLILTVAAVGQTGKQSSFSNFGKIDVAAPGGDFDNGNAGQILSTLDGGYGVESGTSQATPHVTGVVALLMSIPGVTPLQAVQTLETYANHSGLGALPDVNYGFGIVDAYAAISILSTRAIILAPEGLNDQGKSSDPSSVTPPAVETFKPLASFHFNNVPTSNVTFTVDANVPGMAKSFTLAQLLSGNLPAGITDFTITGNPNATSAQSYDVSFRITFSTTGVSQHTITVTGTNPNTGVSSKDTRIFTVTPHVIPSGLSMVSFPYYEDPKDAPPPYTGQFRDVPQLLGTTPTLYRYLLPAEVAVQTGRVVNGIYAAYNATDPKANINASLRPLDIVPTPASAPTPPVTSQPADTRPIGIGYFINAPAAIPVVTFGASYPTTPYRIPLHEGWNMIGDPFPYSVPFNSTEIETAAGARIPVGDAVAQNLILPHIYKLVNGDYQFLTLPNGAIEAWQGHWIFVVPKDPANLNPANVLNLIVPPTPIGGTAGRAALLKGSPALTRATGPGGWKLRLQAHVADQSDANNFIGMSAGATDGNDFTKVPKPPKPDTTVTLAIARPNSPAGLYAQDIRSAGGTKQWNLVVSTDKPNANVTVEWPDARSLPRNYSLILTDQVSGRSLDLRNTSSYQFNSGSTAGTRSFTLVARPNAGIAGHPVFSNILVNPGRAGGRAQNVYNISYNLSASANVSVSIMTPGGHTVAQVVTRAVTSGDNSLTWNGLDNAGRAVPAGSYVLQFQAVTTDGQTSRVIRPIILTGRSQ